MASIIHDGNSYRRLAFKLPDGRRVQIRLGKVSHRQAETVRGHVEELIASKITHRTAEQETSTWLANADPSLIGKLAALGLTRGRETMNLLKLIDGYMRKRGGSLKRGTIVTMNQGQHSLIDHFGANRALNAISEGQAEDYRSALLAQGLAEATVRKRCSNARAWFKYAVKHGHIQRNPFDAVPTSAVPTKRLHYVDEATALKVLDELVSAELRLLFVMSRWGGLRVISEPKLLMWDAIDWLKMRITVKSPKTERYEGHDQRVIPLFPELLSPLREAYEAAPHGIPMVFPMLYRMTSAALRKPMFAAMKRAGVKPWPRLWHNLRASRQTDLAARYPSHVVCLWMGNSQKVARDSYLQVLDGDYERAAQKPAQHAPPSVGTDRHATNPIKAQPPTESEVCLEIPAVAGLTSDPDGITTNAVFRRNAGGHESSGVKSGAISIDHNLARLIHAWAGLTASQKRKIQAIAEGLV